ncbi:MAG TPA: hypothetical protein VKZ70_08025 [Burkholderiaceae bacterium]|nr:hypothetical protein [Burkholderiaceae bacterium]
MSAHQGIETPNNQRKRGYIAFGMAGALLLAGCVAQRPAPEPVEEPVQCKAAAPGDALIGNWLSVRKQTGVAGELHTHIVLNQDGTMRYGEQLRRSKTPPQGLAETGCWHREGQSMVMRTLESNGSPVDTQDPIYVNRYEITRESAQALGMKGPDGANLTFKRMPSDYRLPW